METAVGAKPARASARLAHEMADVIEENLVENRKLAVQRWSGAWHGPLISPLSQRGAPARDRGAAPDRPCWSTRAAIRRQTRRNADVRRRVHWPARSA